MDKKIDQAKAAIEQARKSLPADRADVPLAQCFLLVGDTARAETMIQAALRSPACDPATYRAAVELYLGQGNFDAVEPILDKLNSSATKPSPEMLAWANRTRAMLRLRTGRPAELDGALRLVEDNLKTDHSSPEDVRLKAVILARRTSRRRDAIRFLEPLDQTNQLGPNDQFLLAQTYLSERLVDKYRIEMQRILTTAIRNPQHLIHFITFLIDRQELDEAERRLAELTRAAPRSLALLELQARILDLRKRRPELRELLEARAREAPDEIGAVARLLDRFGFANEAEETYKAYVLRNPKDPERVLFLASFLARQDRSNEASAILAKAWQTCRPEAVAGTAMAPINVPFGRPRCPASGRGLGRRGHPEKPISRVAAPTQAGHDLSHAREIRRR